MTNRRTELKIAIVCFIIAAIAAFFIGCPVPPPPPPPPPATVTLDVCTASGLLPNLPYCPAVEKRTYPKGQEPTTICTVHQQPPPPPPVELKKLLYVSTLDLLTAVGDKEKLIKSVGEFGAKLRIIYQYAWGANVASPYPQVATWRAGYADAPELPFYDQGDGTWEGARWSEPYWTEFRRVHELAKKYDVEVYGAIHDVCSIIPAGWLKYRYSFLSSTPDRAAADPEFNRYPGGFWGMREHEGGRETVQILHEIFIIKVINTLNEIGVKYRLEFANEDSVQGWNDAYAGEYYRWLREFFASRGVPRERLIACGRSAAIPEVGLYSIHGIVRPDRIPDSWLPHAALLISGDGGFDGTGAADAKGRRGLGAADAAAFAQKILDMGYAGIEYMPRDGYGQNNDRMDCDLVDWEPVRLMVEVLKK